MSNKVSRTVSDEELNSIIWIESAGNPNAKAGTSTATGLGQFLKGTWRDTVKKYRPDVFEAYTNGDLLELRKNPQFSIEMLGRFTEGNRRAIGSNASLGDLYLAHFLGVGAAKKFYNASMGSSAAQLAGPNAVRANKSIFLNSDGTSKSVGQVRQWAQSKMDRAMAKAGDYVAKWYTGPFKIPNAHYAALDGGGEIDEPAVHAEEPDDVENVVQRPGMKPQGDYRLYDNQVQLRYMNYNPGGLDGVWGGGTAGAIAAFLNDYAPDTRCPLK